MKSSIFINEFFSSSSISSDEMKTGTWYVAGFVVAFVYFYVYAVNYIRGVRAETDNDHHYNGWPPDNVSFT